MTPGIRVKKEVGVILKNEIENRKISTDLYAPSKIVVLKKKKKKIYIDLERTVEIVLK